MKKLDIIYRSCELEVDQPFKPIRPHWFDKLNCLKTFLESVDNCKEYINSVTFLHDGPKNTLFKNIPSKYEIITIDVQNNEKCLLQSFEIANTLKNNIYFVEDDYLHLKHSIGAIFHGVQAFKLVTGYDHLDRYLRQDDITRGKEFIAFSKKTNCHWRTTESTCCTWACTRELWNSVLKDAVFKFKLNDRDLFRSMYLDNNIRLWTPIPGVTTQVDMSLSPGIDWSKI
jgi:hypothetical protein